MKGRLELREQTAAGLRFDNLKLCCSIRRFRCSNTVEACPPAAGHRWATHVLAVGSRGSRAAHEAAAIIEMVSEQIYKTGSTRSRRHMREGIMKAETKSCRSR